MVQSLALPEKYNVPPREPVLFQVATNTNFEASGLYILFEHFKSFPNRVKMISDIIPYEGTPFDTANGLLRYGAKVVVLSTTGISNRSYAFEVLEALRERRSSQELGIVTLFQIEHTPIAKYVAGISKIYGAQAAVRINDSGKSLFADLEQLVRSIEFAGVYDDGFFSNVSDYTSFGTVTPRESEVAALVAEDLSNKQIAQRLGISSNTIRAHIRSLMQKLDCQSRTGVAIWAVQNSSISENGKNPE